MYINSEMHIIFISAHGVIGPLSVAKIFRVFCSDENPPETKDGQTHCPHPGFDFRSTFIFGQTLFVNSFRRATSAWHISARNYFLNERQKSRDCRKISDRNLPTDEQIAKWKLERKSILRHSVNREI